MDINRGRGLAPETAVAWLTYYATGGYIQVTRKLGSAGRLRCKSTDEASTTRMHCQLPARPPCSTPHRIHTCCHSRARRLSGCVHHVRAGWNRSRGVHYGDVYGHWTRGAIFARHTHLESRHVPSVPGTTSARVRAHFPARAAARVVCLVLRRAGETTVASRRSCARLT